MKPKSMQRIYVFRNLILATILTSPVSDIDRHGPGRVRDDFRDEQGGRRASCITSR